jgi:hypothetical protein
LTPDGREAAFSFYFETWTDADEVSPAASLPTTWIVWTPLATLFTFQA